jgi:hypothetical protein
MAKKQQGWQRKLAHADQPKITREGNTIRLSSTFPLMGQKTGRAANRPSISLGMGEESSNSGSHARACRGD